MERADAAVVAASTGQGVMLPYWFLFLVPALAAIAERGDAGSRRRQTGLAWFVIWLLLTLLIGLRYKVGADWGQYIIIFRYNSYLPFSEVLQNSDPGFGVLNWLAARAGYEIGFVNLICAAVFSWGLIVFVRQQPLPWLALVIAIPYLVTVVAMGYTRQGVAIGFAMLALAGLGANSTVRFAFWIAMAALFHKTAVLLIPMAILATTKSRVWTGIWVGAFGYILYWLLLAEDVDRILQGYIEAEYQSQGATIRVAMNALPAALFLINRRSFGLKGAELNLWTYLSLVALGFIVLLVSSPSSTAVDRMALYFIPIQVYVLSRLPLALDVRRGTGQLAKSGVLAYSAAVLFVWLNFAAHAGYWLPYQMILFAS